MPLLPLSITGVPRSAAFPFITEHRVSMRMLAEQHRASVVLYGLVRMAAAAQISVNEAGKPRLVMTAASCETLIGCII